MKMGIKSNCFAAVTIYTLFWIGFFTVKCAGDDGSVRNFQTTSVNRTHVTFLWDIASSYTSHIVKYKLFYRGAQPDGGAYTFDNFVIFQLSDVTSAGQEGSFTATVSVTALGSVGQYLVWLVAETDVTPKELFSNQIYTEIGVMVAIELNIKLWRGQSCHDFATQSTSVTNTIGDQVYRAARMSCGCSYDFIRSFAVTSEYLTCSSQRFATLRAYIVSLDATKSPAVLVTALGNWLQNKQNSSIFVYGKRYSVEPGDCGLTVPYTNAPFCTSDESTETTAVTNALESQDVGARDNAALIAASATALLFFVLSVILLVYTMFLKCSMRFSQKNSKLLGCQQSSKVLKSVQFSEQDRINLTSNNSTGMDSVSCRQEHKPTIEELYYDGMHP